MSQSSSNPPYFSAESTDLSQSDRHRLLASDRRRVTLDVLADRTSPVALEDLAAAVHDREVDSGRFGTDPDEVAMALHHTHLPLLTDAGVLEYVPSSNRVEAVHATVERP